MKTVGGIIVESLENTGEDKERDVVENEEKEVILWSDAQVDHKIMFKFSKVLYSFIIADA